MNVRRMPCSSSLAAGVGLAGLLGTGIATASAAPAPCTTSSSPAWAPAPTVKLDHHDRIAAVKPDNRVLKRSQQVTSATSSHR